MLSGFKKPSLKGFIKRVASPKSGFY